MDGDGHRGDRRGVDAGRRERDVAVILDEERVGAALGERAGVVERGADHGVHAAGPARVPGSAARWTMPMTALATPRMEIETHAPRTLASAAHAGGATARKPTGHGGMIPRG